MKMFNIDMHIVRNYQLMYFNFDMSSTLWAKRVRTFNVKFFASNNMLCKATESNHAHLMWFLLCLVKLLCFALLLFI